MEKLNCTSWIRTTYSNRHKMIRQGLKLIDKVSNRNAFPLFNRCFCARNALTELPLLFVPQEAVRSVRAKPISSQDVQIDRGSNREQTNFHAFFYLFVSPLS